MKTTKRIHKRFILGPLPLIHIIAQRMRLNEVLSLHVHKHGNDLIDPVQTLTLLIYNLVISKSPLYELQEWCERFDLKRINIQASNGIFSDDRFGKALDKLFNIDRAVLMTDLVISYVNTFGVDIHQLHNDSTSVKAFGDYPGKSRSGLQLKLGHSKDHRPDLKQLIFNLTISADCAVPVHHYCYSGNRTDDTIHIETWNTLHAIFGETNFLYIADSKLCTEKQLKHIVDAGGRAITIVPETWKNVIDFKNELRQKIKPKKIIWRRIKPGSFDEEEYFSAYNGNYRTPVGYRIHWIYSSEKKCRDFESREERLENAENELTLLNAQINKGNHKTYDEIKNKVDTILKENKVTDLLMFEIATKSYSQKTQIGRGRPTKTTKYQMITHSNFSLSWYRNKKSIHQEARTDGVFPLLCTDDSLDAKQILKAYKFQPRLEKRFTQFKSIHNAAPLLFKKVERVEANMFAFFIALALQSLLEREIRLNMKSKECEKMNIYPEDRECKSPTSSIVFDRFSHVSRYEIIENGKVVECYRDELTDAQKEILSILKISESEYWNVNS
jgi:transposase